MSVVRPLFLTLVAVIGLTVTATAQTRLINPIARSYHSQSPDVLPASALMQDGETPAADSAEVAQDVEKIENALDAPAAPVAPDTDPAAPAAPDTDPVEPAADAPAADNQEAERSASDLNIPDTPEPLDVTGKPAEVLNEKDACYDCCGRGLCRCQRGGGSGKPWTLPQPRVAKHLGIKVGGWIQSGISTNNNSPTDNFNSLVALNDRDGEYQVNQMWLYLIKPVNQEGCCWQAGGRVDLMWGTDWRYGRFFGLEERINNDDQLYGWVFPQMYAEFGGHNLSVKVGHMAGPLGYEIVPSVANFFYSHSTAMDYFEPQLVTGVWADYKLNDNWNVQAGVHRGWFMWEDLDSNWDVMGGIQWTSCDKNTSVRYAFTSGRNHGLYGDNWFATSLVLKHKFCEKWEYVMQHNLGTINNTNPGGMFGMGVVGDEEWYGLNQYLFYAINEKLKAGVRVEWMRDDDGGKLAGVGTAPPGTIRGWKGGPGYAGHFYEVTAGLNWSPCPNVRLRPEIRYDWYDGAPSPFPGGALPFDDGLGDDQFTAAFDILVTF